jgi:uncharacterized protein YdhG (YjbR/CyaY superfamily)
MLPVPILPVEESVMTEPATVDEYLAAVPEPFRAALERVRAIIREAAPGATEQISYGMPSYKQGRPLISFAAFKHHCSLFGMSGSLYDALGEEVAGWRTSKGTIQFTPDRPLPEALLRKIIAARLDEIARRDAEKKANKAAKRT